MKFLAACAFLVLNFYIYHYLGSVEVIPPRTSFVAFPTEFGDWKCARKERMAPEVERNLGVTDYLICDFSAGRERPPVGVYVGYHATQIRQEGGGSGESMIHPPAHCLPGSGWDIIGSQIVLLDLPGLPGAPAEVSRLIIAKGEQRQLVYYWYQERGRVIARDWAKIANLFWSRATTGRSDGSLVRFTVPIMRGDEMTAEQEFKDLARQLVPVLPAYIAG